MVEKDCENDWKCKLNEFKKMEAKQIDECHDDDSFDDENDCDIDERDQPYFADPDDKINSPRITALTAISLVCKVKVLRRYF